MAFFADNAAGNSMVRAWTVINMHVPTELVESSSAVIIDASKVCVSSSPTVSERLSQPSWLQSDSHSALLRLCMVDFFEQSMPMHAEDDWAWASCSSSSSAFTPHPNTTNAREAQYRRGEIYEVLITRHTQSAQNGDPGVPYLAMLG